MGQGRSRESKDALTSPINTVGAVERSFLDWQAQPVAWLSHQERSAFIRLLYRANSDTVSRLPDVTGGDRRAQHRIVGRLLLGPRVVRSTPRPSRSPSLRVPSGRCLNGRSLATATTARSRPTAPVQYASGHVSAYRPEQEPGARDQLRAANVLRTCTGASGWGEGIPKPSTPTDAAPHYLCTLLNWRTS